MHKMDSFKKRSHRPWNIALLENTLEESSTLQDAAEQQLQHTLERKTNECHEIHEQLNTREENRLLIGGFLHLQNIFSQNEKGNNTNHLMDELKNKEQEILSLSSDLKISKALEQAEKLEISRKKEEEARKSAENKALFAIQEAKVAAERIYKIEQQLHKEEKARKALEEKNQLFLLEIKKKEQLLLKTEESKLLAEEKIKRVLEETPVLEQRIKTEAEDKIKKIVAGMSEQIEKHKKLSEETIKQSSEKIKWAEIKTDEKIKLFQKQADEKIKYSQAEAEREIREAQRQIQEHEKAKLLAQHWAQKNTEALHQITIAKKEIENKLKIVTQTTIEDREYIRQHEQQKIAIEREKTGIEKSLYQSMNTVKKMDFIIKTERDLRKILEEKLNADPMRVDEQKRKLFENKILELTQELGNREVEKCKVEETLSKTEENLHKLQIMMGSEKTVRASLEAQLKGSMEKIYELECLKQKESDAKQLAEQKVSILLSQKEHLEQEKLQIKRLEEKAKKATQEKISSAIEQANKAVLSALGSLATTEIPNHEV